MPPLAPLILTFIWEIRVMTNQTRKSTALLALPAALLLMAASSPQCARTSDYAFRPTSLTEASSSDMGACITVCNQEAIVRRAAEQSRFVSTIQECEVGDCRAEAAAQHAAIMQEIAADARACRSACHNQGQGQGGQ
jgi:hypothetical protein